MASLPIAPPRTPANSTRYFGPPLPKLETWAKRMLLAKGYRA